MASIEPVSNDCRYQFRYLCLARKNCDQFPQFALILITALVFRVFKEVQVRGRQLYFARYEANRNCFDVDNTMYNYLLKKLARFFCYNPVCYCVYGSLIKESGDKSNRLLLELPLCFENCIEIAEISLN